MAVQHVGPESEPADKTSSTPGHGSAPTITTGLGPDRGVPRSAEDIRSGNLRSGTLCSCTAMSLSSPAGEVLLFQVFGDVDLSTDPVLREALSDSLASAPHDLIVDLAGMTFCYLGGLKLLVETATTAAGLGIGYAVAALPAQPHRVLTLLWPAHELPMQFPSAAAAVLSAMAHQARDDRARWAPKRGPGRVRRWSAAPPSRSAGSGAQLAHDTRARQAR